METLTYAEFLAHRAYLLPYADELQKFIEREQPGGNGQRSFEEWQGLYLDWCEEKARNGKEILK